ncbi:MAG: class I fructose-bisphosphate aldolase [Rhodothermales bacterium]
MPSTTRTIEAMLGAESEYLLGHRCTTIPRGRLHQPGGDIVDRIFGPSDRSQRVLGTLNEMIGHGRLGGTGYFSLFPFDHGVAFGAGSEFVPNPRYFDPFDAIELAVESGCSGVVSTFGVLGAVARRYAHRIPLILKLNHDEQLTHPPRSENVVFAGVKDAWHMGCVGVAATVFFGSPGSRNELQHVAKAFSRAHEFGLATILFCYVREAALRFAGGDGATVANYELAGDITGQANHLGATIEADLIKQKLPTVNGGFMALGPGYGKIDERMYSELMSDHPIDMTRYQVVNGYAGSRIVRLQRCGQAGTAPLVASSQYGDPVPFSGRNKAHHV